MSIPPVLDIVYPDSDGNRTADNTRQADEMIRLKTNLDDIFADRADVFVAMDLLWYAEQGHPEIRIAPDVFVVFGRPKGHRGSYRQWLEDDIVPQFVFEILSPGNRAGEMVDKALFYDQRGVEEYYLYNPENFEFAGWIRSADHSRMVPISTRENWTSPLLGVRFEAPGNQEWSLFRPDGELFLSLTEVRQRWEQAQRERDRAEVAREQAEAAREESEAARTEAEAERDTERLARVQAEERLQRMIALMREKGIEPNEE